MFYIRTLLPVRGSVKAMVEDVAAPRKGECLPPEAGGSTWSRIAPKSPFTQVLGPVFERSTASGRTFAVLVGLEHLNLSGYAHGGFLMTFADLTLSWGHDRGKHIPRVTVSLNCDFIGTAAVHEWLMIDVVIKRIGKTLVFANGDMRVDSKPVAHASAVLRVKPA